MRGEKNRQRGEALSTHSSLRRFKGYYYAALFCSIEAFQNHVCVARSHAVKLLFGTDVCHRPEGNFRSCMQVLAEVMGSFEERNKETKSSRRRHQSRLFIPRSPWQILAGFKIGTCWPHLIAII